MHERSKDNQSLEEQMHERSKYNNQIRILWTESDSVYFYQWKLQLEEEVDEGGILPTYSTWIFALGVVAVASSVLLVAVLPFLKNRIASAYILALLASCNLMVMHVVVHGNDIFSFLDSSCLY